MYDAEFNARPMHVVQGSDECGWVRVFSGPRIQCLRLMRAWLNGGIENTALQYENGQMASYLLPE